MQLSLRVNAFERIIHSIFEALPSQFTRVVSSDTLASPPGSGGGVINPIRLMSKLRFREVRSIAPDLLHWK